MSACLCATFFICACSNETIAPSADGEPCVDYGNHAHLETWTDVRQAHGVTVDGAYAYVTGESLAVLDIANPAHILRQNTLPGPSEDLASHASIQQHRLYAGYEQAGLLIFDLSDPTTPARLGQVDTPGRLVGVAVDGNYAYATEVSDGGAGQGFQVIDVADPAQARIVASIDLPSALGIVVRDGYAYVATGLGPALQIIDVHDPSSPQPIGSVTQTPGGVARDIAIAGSHVYVANGNQVLVVDVADPAHPAIVTRLPIAAHRLSLLGSTLFAVGSEVGAIDVSRPTSPRLVATCKLPGIASDACAVGDSWILTAYYSDSLDRHAVGFVHMLSGPPPQHLGALESSDRIWDLVAKPGTLYMAHGETGLSIVSLADPTRPRLLASLAVAGRCRALDVTSSAAIAVGDGIHVVEITSAEAPALRGSAATPGEATDVAVADSTAYVVSAGSVQIFAIASDTDPLALGPLPGLAAARSVVVRGDRLWTSTWTGVAVADISNRRAPQVLWTVELPVAADDVAPTDGYAYVAAPGCGIVVLACSNDAAPQVIGVCPLESGPWRIRVAGGTLYTNTWNNVVAFDLTNPSTPQRLGSVPVTAPLAFVRVDHALAVASGESAQDLRIYAQQCPVRAE